MIAASSSAAFWYLTRGSGLVSLVLLTVSLTFGILQVQRWAGEGWPRMIISGLHKNVSLLVMVFLGIHIVTAVVDGFAPIGWISTVIPFTSPYRPLWLGLGAIAVDLLIALTVTSLLRSRLSLRTWRVVHWGSYACWPVAFVHGLGTGTDGRVGWVIVLDMACLAAVVAATTWRLASGWQRQPTRRAAGSLALGVVVVSVMGWAALGPTQAGWARRAGTPASLLAPTTTTSPATSASAGASTQTAVATASGGGLTIPFSDAYSGTISQSTLADGSARVTIDGQLGSASSTSGASLHMQIDGTPDSGGGLVMSSSAASMGLAGQPQQYQGTIVRLANTNITMQLKNSSGTSVTVTAVLQIDNTTGTVAGTVTAAGAGVGN